MTSVNESLEFSAATTEEAIQMGLEQLGISAAEAEVEVLDAGSKGLFGLGSRPARVRLTPRSTPAPAPEEKDAAVAPSAAVEAVVAPLTTPAPVQFAEGTEPESELEGEERELVQAGRQVVSDLLERMKIEATVAAGMRRAVDEQDEDTVMVNIEGDDLSILIGRRSETLNALQYISSLILGKQMDSWVPLTIDVQGYRARRERQLRQLARKMAGQAMQSGRKQTLEPMTAAERRIIHLELRGNRDVETESVGEEPNRKVTIMPVNN